MQVKCTSQSVYGQYRRYEKLLTEHTDHPRLDAAKRGPLACELGAGFTGLPKDTFQQGQRAE